MVTSWPSWLALSRSRAYGSKKPKLLYLVYYRPSISLTDPELHAVNPTVYLLRQCTARCQNYTTFESYTWLNMTGVPFFTAISANQTWQMGLRLGKCGPRKHDPPSSAASNWQEICESGKSTSYPDTSHARHCDDGYNNGLGTGFTWTFSLGSQVQINLLFGKENIVNFPSGADFVLEYLHPSAGQCFSNVCVHAAVGCEG
ncbi:hypothetical protein F5I97DRAFT_1881080 [Phlebopus sp. FC_14]|nr:hypothetical protein F5I97DRAFT_1881080 [Phlebopus sp. FC_14]